MEQAVRASASVAELEVAAALTPADRHSSSLKTWSVPELLMKALTSAQS
jgi:hypothetical protein